MLVLSCLPWETGTSSLCMSGCGVSPVAGLGLPLGKARGQRVSTMTTSVWDPCVPVEHSQAAEWFERTFSHLLPNLSLIQAQGGKMTCPGSHKCGLKFQSASPASF